MNDQPQQLEIEYCPNLEELIEWLGDDFRDLEKWTEGKEYIARSTNQSVQIPEPAPTPLFLVLLKVAAQPIK